MEALPLEEGDSHRPTSGSERPEAGRRPRLAPGGAVAA